MLWKVLLCGALLGGLTDKDNRKQLSIRGYSGDTAVAPSASLQGGRRWVSCPGEGEDPCH